MYRCIRYDYFRGIYLKSILASSTYSLITGKSVSKENEHIKESKADFRDFKEEVRMNEMICNKIQTIILLWKEDFETVIESNEKSYSGEKNSYYWLSFDGIKTIILMNPFDQFRIRKTIIEKKRQFY